MISLDKLVRQLRLVAVAAPEELLAREVSGAYCSDLLSDVIAKARKGNVLITALTHLNVIGVAVKAELSTVIMTGGRLPEESEVIAANREGIPVFTSKLDSFEIAGMVHRLLYR